MLLWDISLRPPPSVSKCRARLPSTFARVRKKEACEAVETTQYNGRVNRFENYLSIAKINYLTRR